MIVCVGREKVNWPKGPREAGLGRPRRADPMQCNNVGRGLAPAVVLHCILGDLVGAAPCGRPRAPEGRPYGNTHHVGRGLPDAPTIMRAPSRRAPRRMYPVGRGFVPAAGVPCAPTLSFRGPGGAVGIRSPFDGRTDCHVGPVALLAMTDHGAASP